MKLWEVVRITAAGCGLMLPLFASAQFNYSTNDGTIVITGYTGAGGDVTIPDTINGLLVTDIGASAFYGLATLTNIVIPDGVLNIENDAFAQCSSLSTAIIGNGVTNINEAAFASCSVLTNATIGSSVATVGPVAFRNCYGLLSITIPDSVTNLTQQSFEYCIGLTNVTVGKGIKAIGDQTFTGCIGLPSITIPTNVNVIGSGAFADCYSLSSVALPNDLTGIGSGAFQSTGLATITIPASVTNIGSAAFLQCPDLNAITVAQASSSYSSVDGVLFNKNQTVIIQFPPANSSNNYVIPGSVTMVGQDAFWSCTQLTNIIVSGNVTNIEDGAFENCIGLANVTIDSDVRAIGNDVFNNCVDLCFVKIPDSVRTVGDGVFYDCINLTNAIIGSGVTNLGALITDDSGTFSGCYGLTAIYFRSNAPTASPSVFDGDTNSVLYYLPGTIGWGPTFDGRPTSLWLPKIQTGDSSFGFRANDFGFNIDWADGEEVVVEACSNLNNSIWYSMATDTVSGGTVYFSDPQSTMVPNRFYRIRSP